MTSQKTVIKIASDEVMSFVASVRLAIDASWFSSRLASIAPLALIYYFERYKNGQKTNRRMANLSPCERQNA